MLPLPTSQVDEAELLGFWRRISLVVTFFVLGPITLVLSLFSYISLRNMQAQKPVIMTKNAYGARIFSSLPNITPSFSGEVVAKDARPAILTAYMKQYNSPLTPYAGRIVEVADENELDPRLLVAIAQQESNLCKAIPYNSFNCWGWGITSVSSLSFKSYDEGIETVAKGLKDDYTSRGLITVDQIMTRYNATSPNRSWAKGVSTFMAEMQ